MNENMRREEVWGEGQ